MNNNDILRRLRYAFHLNDINMLELFAEGGALIEKEQLKIWLKKEEDEGFEAIYDKDLAAFLNGFIILKRGKREGELPNPEKSLNNNTIFRKLKIALSLKDEDILEILKLADFKFSKHELSALFRKPEQEQYRVCKDQVLRNFLTGLQVKFHPNKD
jgi:uncharacterized protein YehS (DUF1456 family)